MDLRWASESVRSWPVPNGTSVGALIGGVHQAAAVFPLLGYGWRYGDDPLTEQHVQRQLWRLSTDLTALDMITTEKVTWTSGPCALTLRPGVVLLADLL